MQKHERARWCSCPDGSLLGPESKPGFTVCARCKGSTVWLPRDQKGAAEAAQNLPDWIKTVPTEDIVSK